MSEKKDSVVQKRRLKKVFKIIYAITLTVACTIGVLGNSFFAYRIFGGGPARVIFLVMILAAMSTAFVETFSEAEHKATKITAVAVFGGCGGVVLSGEVSKGKYSDLVIFGYMPCLILMTLCVYRPVRCRDGGADFWKMGVCLVLCVLIPVMKMLRYSFMGAGKLVVWSIFPAALLTGRIAARLSVNAKSFSAGRGKGKKLAERTSLAVLIAFCAFTEVFTALKIIDIAFSPPPEIGKYEIIDKGNVSGSGKIKAFSVQVQRDGTRISVNVPVEAYYDLRIGDAIDVGDYRGALGVEYYAYLSD